MVKDMNIILQCKSGDKTAYEKLFTLCSGKVGQIAYLISGSHDSAENITKDVFIRCFRNISHIRHIKNANSFEHWLLRLIMLSAWDVLRSPSALERNNGNIRSYIETLALGADSLATLESDHSCHILIRSLEKLNFFHRVIIVFRFFHGLTIKDLASVLNCYGPIARIRLHSAVRRLVEELPAIGWSILSDNDKSLRNEDKRVIRGVHIDRKLRMSGKLKKALENSCRTMYITPSLFDEITQNLNARHRTVKRGSLKNLLEKLAYLLLINMKKAVTAVVCIILIIAGLSI